LFKSILLLFRKQIANICNLSHLFSKLLGSAFHHCDKIPEKNQLIKRKDLFCLSISVYGHLANVFRTLVRQNIRAESIW
jgi:hypothetical protein